MGYKKLGKSHRNPEKHRYQFFVTINKKRYREEIACYADQVRQLYREWETKIEKGYPGGTPTLFEIFDEYLEYSKNNKSADMFAAESRTVRLFKSFFHNVNIEDFKRKSVQDYIEWRRSRSIREGQQHLKPATINRDLSTLSSVFTYAITREYFQRVNPVFKMKLRENNERHIRVSPDQVHELLDEAKEQGRIFTVVLLAIFCGLRSNEILTLKWVNIDFKLSIINLDAADTKGKRPRAVPIPSVLLEHLRALRRDNLFAIRILEGWETGAKLRFEWERLRERLSFRILESGLDLHLHDLRHVYAQGLRDSGVLLQDVQAFLGHSSFEVTEKRYAQRGGLDGVDKVNRLVDFFGIREMDVV